MSPKRPETVQIGLLGPGGLSWATEGRCWRALRPQGRGGRPWWVSTVAPHGKGGESPRRPAGLSSALRSQSDAVSSFAAGRGGLRY